MFAFQRGGTTPGSKSMYRCFKEGTEYYKRKSKDKLYLLRQPWRMKGPFYIKAGLLECLFCFFNLDSAMLVINGSECRCRLKTQFARGIFSECYHICQSCNTRKHCLKKNETNYKAFIVLYIQERQKNKNFFQPVLERRAIHLTLKHIW